MPASAFPSGLIGASALGVPKCKLANPLVDLDDLVGGRADPRAGRGADPGHGWLLFAKDEARGLYSGLSQPSQ
eukprot:3429009-Alexandrium_andersonii.AAC.1